MTIPKIIEKELAKRGWKMREDEKWRKPRGYDWACAYFDYTNSKSKRCCLITVFQYTDGFFIEILYRHPICSSYVYTPSSKQFNIDTR